MKISTNSEFEALKRDTIKKGVKTHINFEGPFAVHYANWLILMDYERQVRIPIDFTFEVKCSNVEDRIIIETTLHNYLLFDIYPFK